MSQHAATRVLFRNEGQGGRAVAVMRLFGEQILQSVWGDPYKPGEGSVVVARHIN